MQSKNDKWCKPLRRKGKPTISGGAARNVRIAESGGMDNIIKNALEYVVNRANLLAGETSKPLPSNKSSSPSKSLH